MPALVQPLANGKVNHHGIEVASAVRWMGWEPGQEYTKNIVLKNVKVKTQKIKYKVPESRFFTTLYPQTIVLSAGTSFTLPITFRPLEKTEYEDNVEFATNVGTFVVPIQALLPHVQVEVPEHINFNMCAAEDCVQLHFEIKNTSELVTPFQLESPEPFSVEPTDGVLDPLGMCNITATFKPKAAMVYSANMVVKYGEDMSHFKTTRFEGIGKFPHLLVSSSGPSGSYGENNGRMEATVNFGEVPIGQNTEKWVELYNLSPVNVPFTVEQPSGPSRIDTVFRCLQKEGVVPAMSALRLPMIYNPVDVNIESIDYFNIIAIGCISKTTVRCVGRSIGPEVHLSVNLVNFMQINAGFTSMKALDIVNNSDCEATFQFMLDCNESVFKCAETSGVLSPRSKRTVKLQFQPVHPINYYRKVPCIIHNQTPLFLELLGTCHTETAKPAILEASHIHRHKLHVDRGLSFIPPEHLNKMLSEGKLQVDNDGALTMEKDEASSVLPPLHPMDEYFNDGYHSETTHSRPHVSMDIHQADFGRCTDLRIIETMTVNITNHTKGKISIAWMGNKNNVFSVSPQITDIPPESGSAFQVTFKPSSPNQFYGAELECYACYKSMRDYRLTEDKTHCPPWCLTLIATGHTFLPNNETFLPRYSLDSSKLVFPAVNSNEAAYRTIKLTNTGTTPLLFDFGVDESSAFSLKPTKGLLTGGHQIFVVKILPTAVKIFKANLRLRLNDADKNTQEVLAWGSAESSEVQLDNEGVMYFKPTCVGTRSQREYAVKNTSRIPLRFEWKMNGADAKVLSVVPTTGLIQPNESQYHQWSFTPREETKYVMKPALLVCGQGQSSFSSTGKKKQFTLRSIGEGSLGEIKAAQSSCDFGTIVVGNTESQHIAMMNEGDCSLHYKLTVVQHLDGPYLEEQILNDPCCLTLEQTTGVLPARSRHKIPVTVRPARRCCYQFSIFYQLVTPESTGESICVETEPILLCLVLATGVYPTMVISDAHCYGSALGISKKQLWNLFSLDRLNVALDSDPDPEELRYTMATRQSIRRQPTVQPRSVVDINFSAAPVGSEACVVQLMVENTGSVPTDWAFLLPEELELELEYWAETGDFTQEELHEMKVQDNQLFTIEPSRGCLEPGECSTVTFIYRHVMAGTDRLPVLLKLSRGREIMLNFTGVSVNPDRPYIHFPSSKHTFVPVAIGEKNNPKQVYELYNGGAIPVKYELDVTPLQQLKMENYDHNVFQCINPVGEIMPGRTAAVEWLFSPLEARTYLVDIPIHINNGPIAVVTFTGVGFDKRLLGDTMPVMDIHQELSGIPSSQGVLVPGQLCYLSQERVSFRNMPLFCRARKVVVMVNRSQEHDVMFKWHVTNSSDAQFISVSPCQGVLAADQSGFCRITFTAFGSPAFYDLDLVCEVTNMTEYREYCGQLEAWEAEKLRRQVEFTVTEHDLDADNRLLDTESRPPSGRLKALAGIRTPSPDGDLGKYRTLPPIKQLSIAEQRVLESQERKFQEEFWEYPKPPQPFLLHMGVTGRTHDIADFQANFPEQYQNFYIDRMLSQVGDTSSEDPADKATAELSVGSCVEAEAEIVAGSLQHILRSLLDDSSFHEAISKVCQEDTPYFVQFTSEGPVSDSRAPSQQLSPERSSSQMGSDVGDHLTPEPQLEEDVVSLSHVAVDNMGSQLSIMSSASKLERMQSPAATPEPELLVLASEHPTERSDEQVPSNHTAKPSSRSSVKSAQNACSRQSSKTSAHNQMKAKTQLKPEYMQDQHMKQALKKSPEFGHVVENLLENTLLNIMQEASSEEFNITARPRLVALLPKSSISPRDRDKSK